MVALANKTSKLSLSHRASIISKAEIRNMTFECEKIGGINLAQGICDMDLPLSVIEGACNAIYHGINSYTRHDGLGVLRQAIASKMKTYNGIMVDPHSEIVVSAGSTGALYCACLALLDPGDEVVVFEPFYSYHINTILAVDAVPRFVRMNPPDWMYDSSELEQVIGPKTKAILINTPGNPSGRIYSQKELEHIADLASKHDLFVFSDEIYEYFVYDGAEHLSPGALPGMEDRTITVSGYSKTFSITGWRIGYCVCNKNWAEMIGYVNDLVYVCAPAPLQAGVAAGIEGIDHSYYDELRRQFLRKRELICRGLEIAGFKFSRPQGSYYVLADASHLPGPTSKRRAMYLLEKTGVAAVPGEAFFSSGGETLLRFCYAKDDNQLLEACDRLSRL